MHMFDFMRGVRHDFGHFIQPSSLQLRLVSKAFDRAMARIWFRTEHLTVRVFDRTAMFSDGPGGHEELERRTVKPNSVDRIKHLILQGQQFPAYLRHLRLELSTQDGFSNYDRRQWLNPNNPKTHTVDRESLLACLRVLPIALEKMERLESLWYNLTEIWESNYTGSGEGSAPQLDLFALDELRKSLCSLFSSSYAHKFSCLTELRLTLSCTYDFAALNSAMADEVCQRLCHLYLEYVDATGPGGSNDYLHWAEDDQEDGDEEFPVSNLQEIHPNRDYMPDICRLIGRCTNLESLGLRATHYLDLDELDWNPQGSGLQSIYIHRARISLHALKKLLSAADGKISAICALRLEYVHLLDRTWAEIFDHLIQVNGIKYFGVKDLNYALRGTSAHLREFNNRPWENCNNIWSEHDADRRRLRDLVKNVLDNGGFVGNMLEDEATEAGYDVSRQNKPNHMWDW